MFRLVHIVAIGLALSAVVATAAAAEIDNRPQVNAASAGAEVHSLPVSVQVNSGLGFKPTTWVPYRIPRLGVGMRLTNLKWSQWGRRSATAKGRMTVCAGRCTTGPVTLRMTRLLPAVRQARSVYACMRIVRTNAPELRNANILTVTSDVVRRPPNFC